MGLFRRRRYYDDSASLSEMITEGMEKGGKVYKILFNTALLALFVPIAIIITGIVRGYLSSGLMLAMVIIAIIGFASILSLHWVRNLENGKEKIVSIVLLVLTGITTIIWIISAIVIIALYEKAKANANFNYAGAITFIKVSLIISLQFITANFITRMILKYKTSYIAVQAIAYASNLYIDIWLTLLLCCVSSITASGFEFNKQLFFTLIGPTMATLFLIALVYSALVNNIIKTTDQRRVIRAAETLESHSETTKAQETAKANDSVEAKLEKLQALLDKKLITQEEFDKKRQDIINDM